MLARHILGKRARKVQERLTEFSILHDLYPKEYVNVTEREHASTLSP